MASKKLYETVTEDLKKAGWSFRMNDLDESLEYSHQGGPWETIHDTIDALVAVDMREMGYGTRKKPSLSAMGQCVTKLAHENRYNPIRNYFEGLAGKYEPQDSGPYFVPMLCDYITNPDGALEKFLFRWMVGCIAKVFAGERNPMLVLDARQKIGKSYFCRWICPLQDRFVQGPIRPDSKDHKLALVTNFIWEAEELGASTRRTDAESMKSFLTLPEIKERLPYGKKPIRKPVSTNFIGTVNFDGAGFLVDSTGHTRFLCAEVTHINFAYSKNVKRDDLWAEAYWYYKNIPNSWRLTPEEEALQADINSRYEIQSALEDVVLQYMTITEDMDDFMTTVAIKGEIDGVYKYQSPQALQNEIGRVLNKLGCTKGRQAHSAGGLRGWHGIKKSNTTETQSDPKDDVIPF